VTLGKIYRMDPGARSGAEFAAASWIFKHLAAGLKSSAPLPLRRNQVRERMLARLHEVAPGETRTVRTTDGEWRALAPGVTIKLLRSDTRADNMTAFFRVQPGAALDSHVHHQPEECLVLEGEIFIGTHRLCAGDMHVAAAGTAHAPTTSPRGALLLVRTQLMPSH
jgi:quercetin dioxygenase-like cupin family protein